jgi:type VI secretion system protein ImpL
MFAILKRRAFHVATGFALLALFIWYAGPYVQFADYRPLESVGVRLFTIALVIACWAASLLLKRLRANRASDRLAAVVVKPASAEPPNPEAVRLREQFDDAIATLKEKRRGGHGLYDLPWYVIIGAPGAGKTTALVNSGLHFPLEQRMGKQALRGVGGTRDCDWWFTDEAVFLDTAGRYTTQDSDVASDRAGWTEFLSLLRKYRRRRPVNGVILAISAHDLMLHGHGEREAHVAAVRRRLDELNRELHIQLPVYLLVTKCDLVAGFSEYFDDLAQEGRAQVWGVTFPYEQTIKGEAANACPAEFDALMTRLNARVFARLEEERDVRRRARVFGFPQQMAALREALSRFVADVFVSTRFDRQALLRGVYFTSGTQEGTPIDRLLGALGRRFAVAPDSLVSSGGRGKAYFIEHLLKQVLLAESGLAGVNRRVEMQKAALQLGAYAAAALVALLGVIAVSVSYSRNRAYIAEVAADVEALEQVPVRTAGASIETLLPRLEAVRAVADSANRYRSDAPWSMRWGLFQGDSLGNAARDAYSRELDGALLPQVKVRIEQRLVEYVPEPEKLYEYLKAYLMLAEPEHLDKLQLGFIADLEWKSAYADDPETGAAVAKHFRSLLEYEETLRPLPLDPSLVAQARSTVQQASIPQLIYRQLRLNYTRDTARALRLDVEAGLGAEQVFRRKSGKSLVEPVPSLYTRDVFNEIARGSAGDLVEQFAGDHWVWGESRPSITSSAKLKAEVTDVYERDYIAAWDDVLGDIELVPLPSLATTNQVLGILSGPTSPLRGLLQTVRKHTLLVEPPDPAKAGALATASRAVRDRLGPLFEQGVKTLGMPVTEPGAAVTAHFDGIHRMLAGEAGSTRLDPILQQIARIQQELQSVGREVGNVTPLEAITRPGPGAAVKSLERDAATLPRVVGALVTQIGRRSATVATSEAGSELAHRYQQDVLQECDTVIGQYPFAPASAADVPLADFGRLFGYGGVFDSFFKEHLESLVDTTRSPWVWRADASGAAVGGSAAMLRRFEAARRLRDMFFQPGSQMPELRFTITPIELDAAATRVLLEVDGQNIEYRHGPERSWPVTWPGSDRNQSALTFDDRAGSHPVVVFDGAWAWFRVIDAAQMQRETDVRHVLTFVKDGHQARLRLDAASVRNPYGKQELQQFRCG